MTATLTIDKAGRVVLPKSLREELHLEAGDRLELDSEGEYMTLRPVRASSRMEREQGVWVLQDGEPMTAEMTDKLIRELRDERVLINCGLHK